MSEQYENLVRILGNDIHGELNMLIGLRQIKGIGYMFANSMLQVLKINPHQKVGNLTTEQISSIEKIIQDPKAANFPIWFLNRRQDIETGEDMHLVTSDIAFNIRNDVEREKTLFSWRGYRHMYGLKVRGQRTRCTGRKGGAVGVAKGGKVLPKGGAGAPAGGGAVVEGTPAVDGAAPAADAKAAPAADAKAAPAAEKKE
ncbi:MAG: 30S ribosomal protein S13 [Candidatus Nitrosopelagicus sp.]|uniref:Small ribosomal subunit protein uS13 n=1 Tax=uncultured marine thaumarchaeote AD1000_54_F09 TaxID=1455926 RepID=A0A075FUD8_9ARCH|nr:ribosomal protein S13 (RP-S13, rpsM) [uncultured marine thaumarchaeote AD1000_54_F09]MBT3591497.1 30S ribosomal protein S13 [Candidatus Nitrosopelagicus sp.]MBT6647443.1 30S ribosomal protein S13 [Nitrososphaerota archaeon]MBT4455226.1 30S ribosomal protein S13 [Candidatus Nitrosopelagicus sp.]MBT5171296.1 30S ribosomal protein S13 [Candidatus Nitrosopelagicus sp.]